MPVTLFSHDRFLAIRMNLFLRRDYSCKAQKNRMTNRETRDQAREAGQGEIYVMGSARVRNEEKEGR